MKQYVVKAGRTSNGKSGYSLRPADKQPVTRQDIINLQEALTWPPVEMRDPNLVEMQKQRNALNDVWNDPHLDPTSKLLRASLHSQLFAIANKKYFSRGEPTQSSSNATPSNKPNENDTAAVGTPATPSDRKQAHSLIPRYRGTPLSMSRSLIHVPEHRKSEGQRMLMALKSPASPLTWDDQGQYYYYYSKMIGEKFNACSSYASQVNSLRGRAVL